jgi:Kef-type K+ transport system membrane component KefB/Trk K+ transport system NAD-binding subunit
MAFENIFYEITAILLVASVVGVLGLALRQPLIVSLLAAGILVGPSGTGLITSHDQIELLAHIGISLLLFVVGLKLDLHLIRTMGKVALATGLGQVIFTSIFGFFIALGLGLPVVAAVYVAVALTFSSTIIIVKLLSDKREIDSLHGRIAIGFLIVQDIVVVLVMIGLSAFGDGGGSGRALWMDIAWVIGKGAAFFLAVAVAMRYVFPALLPRLARSQELLVLFSIAWAILLASLGDALGFSKEVGAFLGGVSLASTPFREAIGTRLVSLRDFLLVFFFIDLGSRLDLSMLGTQLPKALVFSLFVLIGNPIIVMAIMGYMGYRRRTGFLAGLTVAQISEFSLILGALGLSLGHINQDIMGLITLVGLVTIGVSTYMILYSGRLYQVLTPWLRPLERQNPYRETERDSAPQALAAEVILLGLGNYGGAIARKLLRRNKQVVGVDFDPEVLTSWRPSLPVLYGDVGDPEILEHLPVDQALWVVSTVRDRDLNLGLQKSLENRNFLGKVVLTASNEDEAEDFLEAGADAVLRPFADAADLAVEYLLEAMHLLPKNLDWPFGLLAVRLALGSPLVNRSLREIPLRRETGVSIIAVGRAGISFYDPEPELRLTPGDRLILVGRPENLKQAREWLEEQEAELPPPDDQFALAQIEIATASPLAGKTLAEARFREAYGVTVIGVRQKELSLISPMGQDRLHAGDSLLIAGKRTAVDRIQQTSPL